MFGGCASFFGGRGDGLGEGDGLGVSVSSRKVSLEQHNTEAGGGVELQTCQLRNEMGLSS